MVTMAKMLLTVFSIHSAKSSNIILGRIIKCSSDKSVVDDNISLMFVMCVWHMHAQHTCVRVTVYAPNA